MSIFQGGPCVDVFGMQGTDPFKNVGASKGKTLKKEFNKEIKGFVLNVEGGHASRVDFPNAASKKGLGLTQRFLCFQMFLPITGDPFSIELAVCDSTKTRRRMVISSGFRALVSNPLHVQLPLGAAYAGSSDAAYRIMPRGEWFTLCLDMHDLISSTFAETYHRSLESFSISGNAQVRRIFTLKDSPSEGDIPRALAFPAGVEAALVVYRISSVQEWARSESSVIQQTAPMEIARKTQRATSSFAPEINPRVPAKKPVAKARQQQQQQHDPRNETPRSSTLSTARSSLSTGRKSSPRSNQHDAAQPSKLADSFVSEADEDSADHDGTRCPPLASARSYTSATSSGPSSSATRKEEKKLVLPALLRAAERRKVEQEKLEQEKLEQEKQEREKHEQERLQEREQARALQEREQARDATRRLKQQQLDREAEDELRRRQAEVLLQREEERLEQADNPECFSEQGEENPVDDQDADLSERDLAYDEESLDPSFVGQEQEQEQELGEDQELEPQVEQRTEPHGGDLLAGDDAFSVGGDKSTVAMDSPSRLSLEASLTAERQRLEQLEEELEREEEKALHSGRSRDDCIDEIADQFVKSSIAKAFGENMFDQAEDNSDIDEKNNHDDQPLSARSHIPRPESRSKSVPLSARSKQSVRSHSEKEPVLDLIYDNLLDCYYDPVNDKYYKKKA